MERKKLLSLYTEYLIYYSKYSKNTVQSYLADLNMFFDFLKFNDYIDFSKLNLDTTEKYFNKIFEQLKKSTANRKQKSLRKFYSFLFENNLINYDISLKIKLSNIDSIEHVYYTQKQVFKFFDKSLKFDTALNFRNSLMILLLYSTGLRVSELLSLKTNNVNLSQKVLLINGKGNKERFVPLSDKMIDLINEYYSNYYMDFHSLRQKEYLFLNYHGNQLTRQSIKKIIDDYIEVSKMDLKLTAHVFRHLCATHLLENGVNLEDLQGYLGHEHISSTEVYLTLSPKFIQKQYLKHHFIK